MIAQTNITSTADKILNSDPLAVTLLIVAMLAAAILATVWWTGKTRNTSASAEVAQAKIEATHAGTLANALNAIVDISDKLHTQNENQIRTMVAVNDSLKALVESIHQNSLNTNATLSRVAQALGEQSNAVDFTTKQVVDAKGTIMGQLNHESNGLEAICKKIEEVINSIKQLQTTVNEMRCDINSYSYKLENVQIKLDEADKIARYAASELSKVSVDNQA